MQDVPDAEIDRDRVPRRADAERIDMAVGEAVHHVRRRQHDEPHVLVGIDTAGGHPEPQLVIVGRERKRHAEGQRFGAGSCAARDDHAASAFAVAIGSAGSPSSLSDMIAACSAGDTVMALPFRPRLNDATIGTLTCAEPEARGDGHRRQQMRGIEQADIELVADIRPRHFAHQRHVQPFGRGEALVDGDDQGGGVRQRNEADPEAVWPVISATPPR